MNDTTTGDLFDGEPSRRKRLRAGRALRDKGISDVIAAERAEWLASYVLFAFNFLLRHGVKPIIAETVRDAWIAMGQPPPHHHNVYSAAWNIVARRGWVVPYGSVTQSARPSRHACQARIWVSTLGKKNGEHDGSPGNGA